MSHLQPRGPLVPNFQLRPLVLINGDPVPATSWSVDIHSFSMASRLEATILATKTPGFKALPDYGAVMAANTKLPFEIQCGYSQDGRASNFRLESGIVDERESSSDEREQSIRFTGRSTASLFQDLQITKPIDHNRAGSAIIADLFAKQKVPLEIRDSSPTSRAYVGRTSGDPIFNTTATSHTEWDLMAAIATTDGLRLSVHNGKGTYGTADGDPTLGLNWKTGLASRGGGFLVGYRLRHSPRRSHNIKVIVRSHLHKGKTLARGVYGNAAADRSETFLFDIEGGKNTQQCKARAQAIFYDLARREYLVTFVVVPDETLMRTIAERGANFSIILGGEVPKSEQRTYGVRHVALGFNVDGKPPLTATILAGNLNPSNEGAELA